MIQKIELKEDFVLIENQFIDLGKITHYEIYPRGFKFYFLGDSMTAINFGEEIATPGGGWKTETKATYYTVKEFLKKRFKPKDIKEPK